MVFTLFIAHPATPIPLVPPNLTAAIINASAVQLSWTAPPSHSEEGGILSYDITYTRLDSTIFSTTVGGEERAFTIIELPPGMYTFNISALYEGRRGPVASATVTLVARKGVVEQPWFFGTVGGVAAILVLCILILAVCICYQLCCRKARFQGQTTPPSVGVGWYYCGVSCAVGGKQEESIGVSAASNHFSEYRRKAKSSKNGGM